MQMEIFMSGMGQLGIALDKLLEQQVLPARLDQQVLQEAQVLQEQLAQLDLKEMWELLDQLVPQEQQAQQD
jgi:patatin-like phospholipase/acyl hydrolase